jgi:hypothetical protein
MTIGTRRSHGCGSDRGNIISNPAKTVFRACIEMFENVLKLEL